MKQNKGQDELKKYTFIGLLKKNILMARIRVFFSLIKLHLDLQNLHFIPFIP